MPAGNFDLRPNRNEQVTSVDAQEKWKSIDRGLIRCYLMRKEEIRLRGLINLFLLDANESLYREHINRN